MGLGIPFSGVMRGTIICHNLGFIVGSCIGFFGRLGVQVQVEWVLRGDA